MPHFGTSSPSNAIPPTNEYRHGFCQAAVTVDGRLFATWINPDDRILIVEPSSQQDHCLAIDMSDIPAFVEMLERTLEFMRAVNDPDLWEDQ